MIVLIDGDIPLYSCSAVTQRTTYNVSYMREDRPEDVIVETHKSRKTAYERAEQLLGVVSPVIELEPISHAIHNMNRLLESVMAATGADEYVIYISGDNNYREMIADYYKQSRQDQRKPEHYEELKRYLLENYHVVITEDQEADDALGIHQSTTEETTCIATIDKDLRMIPGLHYHWRKDKKPVWVSPLEANRFFYKQLLTGDTVDDIPGLYKMTGKKAYRAYKDKIDTLTDPYDMWNYVLRVFTKAGAKEEQVIEIARLLWIRRKENEIWTPPEAPQLREEVHGQVPAGEDSG